jgi:hypothetical protein
MHHWFIPLLIDRWNDGAQPQRLERLGTDGWQREARQSRAWMDAGWEVTGTDLSGQLITFRRR